MSIKFGADNPFGKLESILVSIPKVAEKANQSINPWQEKHKSYNLDKATQQHQSMVRKLEQEGIKVYNLPIQDCDITQKDCRDVGLISENGAVVATQKHRNIKGEEKEAFIDFCQSKDIPVLNKDKTIRFEGGDYFPVDRSTSLLGIGPRTEKSSKVIGDIIEKNIQLVYHNAPHHLDSVFNLVSENTVVCMEEKVEKTEWFEDKKILNITEKDVRKLAGNYLILGEDKILANADCDEFNNKLKEEGIEVLEADISELKKEGGGIRCMTLPILKR